MFRFAYLHLGNAEDAEDIAQETFLRAFRSLDRFDVSRSLRPWLLSIAANLARNRRRSLARYWAALTRLIPLAPQLSTTDPASGPAGSRDAYVLHAQALWQEVQKLDETDREVIYLRYFLELSTEETAMALGVVEGTVKSRAHRARARLRKILEEEYPALREESGG